MTTEEKKKQARLTMQGCVLSTILPSGVIAGLDTVRDCMRNDSIRSFMGYALLREIMPCMGLNKDVLEPVAIAICREMEYPTVIQPLALLLPNAVRAWKEQALPVILTYLEREEALPPCLCMGLSTLIMLFAGARLETDGRYTIPRKGDVCYLNEDEEILFSFSRLSCDMPADSLAYAVLSDRAIWDRDLRDVPGLEDLISDQLRDLQLLGLFDALDKAWKKHTS